MPGERLVVDASIVVKWVIPEEYSEHAVLLRDDHLDGRVEAHAPDLLLLEAASALRKYVLRGLLEPGKALRALQLLSEAGIGLEPVDGELALEALRLSLQLGITPYDAAYIALARRLQAPLYTADDRLASNPAVASLGIVRHIREYGAAPGR